MKDYYPGHINPEQLDALKELINIGVGQGGEILNSILQSHISLSVPKIEIIDYKSIHSLPATESDTELSAVEMSYRGSFSGSIQLVFPKSDATKLVNLLAGDDSNERRMDEIRSGTLKEIGNVLLNAVMGTISNFFSFSLRYSLPVYLEGSIDDLLKVLKTGEPSIIIRARTRFTIDDIAVDGSLILFFAIKSFGELISKVASYSGIL